MNLTKGFSKRMAQYNLVCIGQAQSKFSMAKYKSSQLQGQLQYTAMIWDTLILDHIPQGLTIHLMKYAIVFYKFPLTRGIFLYKVKYPKMAIVTHGCKPANCWSKVLYYTNKL